MGDKIHPGIARLRGAVSECWGMERGAGNMGIPLEKPIINIDFRSFSLIFHDFSWIFIDFYGCSLIVHEFLRTFIDFHGFSMDVYGFSLIFHGCSWIFVDFH